jgi:hypothetical protein
MADIKEIKQKKGVKRNTIDKYYTNNDIVLECIKSYLSG